MYDTTLLGHVSGTPEYIFDFCYYILRGWTLWGHVEDILRGYKEVLRTNVMNTCIMTVDSYLHNFYITAAFFILLI